MTEIPENEVTAEDLAEWYRLNEQLGKLKSAEALLRAKIFRGKFPNPIEGTNKIGLADGTGAELKGTHVINRSIDPGALDAMQTVQTGLYGETAIAARKEAGAPPPNEPQLPLGKLIKYKPELVLSEYRKLTAEERDFFDLCLIIKPGSPQLEISIPKTPKR